MVSEGINSPGEGGAQEPKQLPGVVRAQDAKTDKSRFTAGVEVEVDLTTERKGEQEFEARFTRGTNIGDVGRFTENREVDPETPRFTESRERIVDLRTKGEEPGDARVVPRVLDEGAAGFRGVREVKPGEARFTQALPVKPSERRFTQIRALQEGDLRITEGPGDKSRFAGVREVKPDDSRFTEGVAASRLPRTRSPARPPQPTKPAPRFTDSREVTPDEQRFTQPRHVDPGIEDRITMFVGDKNRFTKSTEVTPDKTRFTAIKTHVVEEERFTLQDGLDRRFTGTGIVDPAEGRLTEIKELKEGDERFTTGIGDKSRFTGAKDVDPSESRFTEIKGLEDVEARFTTGEGDRSRFTEATEVIPGKERFTVDIQAEPGASRFTEVKQLEDGEKRFTTAAIGKSRFTDPRDVEREASRFTGAKVVIPGKARFTRDIQGQPDASRFTEVRQLGDRDPGTAAAAINISRFTDARDVERESSRFTMSATGGVAPNPVVLGATPSVTLGAERFTISATGGVPQKPEEAVGEPSQIGSTKKSAAGIAGGDSKFFPLGNLVEDPRILPAQFSSSGVTKLAQIGPGATGFENFPPPGLESWEMQAPFSGVTGGQLAGSKREFAVCCAYNGILFLETEDPSQGRKYFFPDSPATTHRGVATYSGYVYAINADSTGIRVFKVTDEDGVFLVTIVKDRSGQEYHNQSDLSGLLVSPRLTIDEERGHLYVCSPDSGSIFRKVKVFAINAADGTLSLMRELAAPESVRNTAFDVFLRRLPSGETWAYISSFNKVGSPNSIVIVDVTNIKAQAPDKWTALDTDLGLAHSAWVTDDGRFLFESFNDQIVAVGSLLGIAPVVVPPLIVDAQPSPPPPFPVLEPQLRFPLRPAGLHHFEGIGNTGYASAWEDGFWLTHIVRPGNPLTSQPTAIKKIAFFDTYDGATFPGEQKNGFKGLWGVYPHQDSGMVYASDRQSGLFILQVDVGHLNRFGQATFSTGEASLRITAEHAPPFVTEAGLPSIKLTIRNIPSEEKVALEATIFGALETPVDLNGGIGPRVDKWIVSMSPNPERFGPPVFFAEKCEADCDGVVVVDFSPLVGIPVGTLIYCQAYSYTGPVTSPRYTGASRGTWFGLAPRNLL